MKKLITYIFIITSLSSLGQELNLPVYTQYLADNDFVVSPTFAGIGDNLKVRANGLTQWVGIKNAPDNQSVYADFRIAARSGIGLSFYNDSNGNTFQQGAKFSFAHHLVLDYTSRQYLSFGISYNINTFRIDYTNFTDGTVNAPPLGFLKGDRFNSNNNFDIGALYRKKGYYISFNANNLLEKKLDATYLQEEPELLLNYQVYSGYVFRNPSNRKVEIEPSIFYQMFVSDKRSSTDLNIRYRKFSRGDDYIWTGVSYRFLNDQFLKPLNIGPMAGFMKSGFYFGYAYQITANDFFAFNSGTHVVTIGINLLKGVSNCPCTEKRVVY